MTKPKGGFILHDHYAVVFRVNQPKYKEDETRMIMSQQGWEHAQKMHKEGHIVVLEAWDITTGKCVSN